MRFIVLSLSALMLFSCATRTPNFKAKQSLSIFQGATGLTDTELNVLIPRKKEVRFLIKEKYSSVGHNFYKTKKYSSDNSKWSVWQVQITKLNPKLSYVVDVIAKDGEVLDRREFKTFKHKGKTLDFAAASCLSDREEEGIRTKMWSKLVDEKPELIFLIGDNVYADYKNNKYIMADANQLWDRHVETRNKLEVFKLKKLIPIYAIWDDHDYGVNDGGGNYAFKKESLKIFKTFWSQFRGKSYLKRGPGASYLLQTRSQKFFFMDGRYFRTPNRKKMRGSGMFGRSQLLWLDRYFDKGKIVPNWIINGTQLWTDYHPFESYNLTHPREFQNFKYMLNVRKSLAVFLSGDRHLTEIVRVNKNKLGYQSYELTTSPLHAKVYPGSFKKWPNKDKIDGADGEYNFMFIKSRAEKENEIRVEATAVGLGRVLYSRSLKVKN